MSNHTIHVKWTNDNKPYCGHADCQRPLRQCDGEWEHAPHVTDSDTGRKPSEFFTTLKRNVWRHKRNPRQSDKEILSLLGIVGIEVENGDSLGAVRDGCQCVLSAKGMF